MKRNIYLILPTEAGDDNISWDSYLGFVVIADNPKEARGMCYDGSEGKETWANPKYSTVKKIGESNQLKGCVLSSFNAG